MRDKNYDVLSETRINEEGAKALDCAETIRSYKKEALGWKISGAGGGGYLVLVSEKRVENAMQVKIRR